MPDEELTAEQRRIVARFRRLVKDARKADLFLAVDAAEWSLRFIPKEVERRAEDLGAVGVPIPIPHEPPYDLTRGEAVAVDSACGTRVPSRRPVM